MLQNGGRFTTCISSHLEIVKLDMQLAYYWLEMRLRLNFTMVYFVSRFVIFSPKSTLPSSNFFLAKPINFSKPPLIKILNILFIMQSSIKTCQIS